MARAKSTGYILPTLPAYRPYALALGQLALAWNALHETLALLYCTIMGGGVVNQHLAVWHALKADRAQRDILLAAAQSNTFESVPTRFMDDIKWICGRADALEDLRNDALHSPLVGHQWHPDNVEIAPRRGLGHIRAQKLGEKDLLAEFRYCRDAAIALSSFAERMDRALSDYSEPWPDRPVWPTRRETNTTKPRRQAHKAKRPRQPRSSLE
jgi:hypothetical protein